MLLQERSFTWGTGPCWGWSSPRLLQEHPAWHSKHRMPCTLSPKPSQSIFLGKVSTEMERYKKYLCSLCWKANWRRWQNTPPANTWCFRWCQRLYLLCCNSSLPKGCVRLRNVLSMVYVSFRPLLRTHGCLAHWGCSLICSQFSPTPSRRHIKAFISLFLHTPSATRDHVSCKLELLWGFIWLKKICSNKIKVYMHPIEKDMEVPKGWAWSPLKGEWAWWLRVRRAATLFKITSS